MNVNYAFKQLFDNEKNKEMPIVFFNVMFNFHNGEYEEDKQLRLDLLMKTTTNEC